MKSIQKIPEVKSFAKAKNAILKKDDTILTFGNELMASLEDCNEIIGYQKDKLLVLNSRNQAFLVDKYNSKPFLADYRINIHSNRFLGLYQRGNSSYAIYCLESDRIVFNSKKWEGHAIIDELIFSNLDGQISCLNISSKKKLSSCPLPNGEKEKVFEFSGVYQNKLICTLVQHDILLIDYTTGKIINQFKKPGVSYYLSPKDSEKKFFWGLMGTTFIEIDMIKNTIPRKVDISSQLASIKNNTVNSVFIRTSVVKNQLVFFVADKNIVGIFNPVTNTIVSHSILSFDKKNTSLKVGRRNLQVDNNNIYVLDSENNLHVIEYDLDIEIAS